MCKFETSTKTKLRKHYRLHHGHGGQPFPCLYQNCLCSFKTWSSLKSHLTRNHSQETQETVRSSETLSFSCQCCNASAISTERQFFEHLGRHLKKHDSVVCVFKNCNLNINIYGTFASHRSRKHTPHTLQDFKEGLLKRYAVSTNTADSSDEDVQDVEQSITDDGQDNNDVRDLSNLIEKLPAYP